MKSVREIPALQNIPVIVRAALNVPLENGVVTNDYRLKKALPTINYLVRGGARVVLISHLGEKGTETLAPIAKALQRFIPQIAFCPESIGERARAAVRALPPGGVLVMENLRRHKGEVGNDPAFATELAHLGDVFVEDSFDTCHRVHASIVTLPTLLPAYAGLLVEEEVAALATALAPRHPALAIVGGAKFSTKEPVLTTLLTSYEQVFVGGALANDFLKAAGHEVGSSVTSDADPARLINLLKNPRLILPVDVRVIPTTSVNDLDINQRARVARLSEVREDEIILDLGPATSALLSDLAKKSHTVMWNGPLGKYESGFVEATNDLARAIAETSAHSVVGGGDTVASIENLGLMPRFSFVSTGGGAMLEFLAKGTLPGIVALERGGF